MPIRLIPILLAGALWAGAQQEPRQDSFTISRVKRDRPLTSDPAAAFWSKATSVVTSHDRYGQPVAGARTEIRGLWSRRYLYLLFGSQFEKLKLKTNPSARKETWGLWDYDVVEVFIGSDLGQIDRYKEFEISPQNEWVDLDVDRGRKGKEVDWEWDAGMEWSARVDQSAKVWYCAMRIPWKAIAPASPAVRAGREFRLNLYRIEGEEPNRKYIAWRPVHSPSFHTPSAFGRLKLAE